MESKIKSIEIAADWWAKKISNPTGSFSNGTNADFFELMALKTAKEASSRLSQQQIANFKEELSTAVESEIEKRGLCYLQTDYAPAGKLAEVANNTDIPRETFPIKTNMRVTKESVEVSDGYRKPYEKIYQK